MHGYNHEGKSKVFPVCTIEMCRGGGGIGTLILNLRTGWRLVVNFTPGIFAPPRKQSWYPLNGRLDGPQSQSGLSGEGKISFPYPHLSPGPSNL